MLVSFLLKRTSYRSTQALLPTPMSKPEGSDFTQVTTPLVSRAQTFFLSLKSHISRESPPQLRTFSF